MPVFTEKRFNENLNVVKANLSTVKATIQELLIYACFKAFKDGNTTPMNALLDTAVNSKAVDVKRLTKWVELHAGICRIKDEKFILNKKVRDESGVTDEKSFAPFEEHLRALPWYNIEGKPKAVSVWDVEDYLGSVYKTIEKHTYDADAPVDLLHEAMKAVNGVKARIASERANAEYGITA